MTYIMVDIESDGPIPGDYSMISIGAVVVDENLDKTFRRDLKPISKDFREEALNICGVTREETLGYPDAAEVMTDFERWVDENSDGQPRLISDNNGFDWMFICWYFHHFCGRNPFGYSSTNLGSLYKGFVKDLTKNFKHLRDTVHTHDPLDDAIGNAEAFRKICEMMGIPEQVGL
jgi:DNA polymerase III epsilon subunit-like protein